MQLHQIEEYLSTFTKSNCLIPVCRGADIECCDKDNYTPLLMAASSGHTAVVELLLKRRANLKAKDTQEKTAIYLAAEENSIDTLKVQLIVFRHLL